MLPPFFKSPQSVGGVKNSVSHFVAWVPFFEQPVELLLGSGEPLQRVPERGWRRQRNNGNLIGWIVSWMSSRPRRNGENPHPWFTLRIPQRAHEPETPKIPRATPQGGSQRLLPPQPPAHHRGRLLPSPNGAGPEKPRPSLLEEALEDALALIRSSPIRRNP